MFSSLPLLSPILLLPISLFPGLGLILAQLFLGSGWMEQLLLSVLLWALGGCQPLAGLSLAQGPVQTEQSLETAHRRDLELVNRCSNPFVKVVSESGHEASFHMVDYGSRRGDREKSIPENSTDVLPAAFSKPSKMACGRW